MPPVVAAAAITAGAGLYSASQSKKAANKAAKAQDAAAQRQLEAQQRNFDRIVGLNEPYIAGGNVAFDALMQRFGLSPAAGSQSGAPAPATRSAGGAYIQANPDVQAEFQRLSSTPEGQAQLQAIGATTPEAFGNYHYQTFGQYEGRAAPAAPQAAEPNPPTITEPDPNAPPDLMNARRPDAAPMPTFERPNPFSAPALPSVNWQDIQNDPGFKWELQQGLDSVNAASAARGKLRSGDAAKALQDRGYGVAHSYGQDYFNRALSLFDRANQQYQYGQSRADNIFADDRAFDMSQWQYGTERGDRNFDTDRAYQTNRYDTLTNNIFGLANIGQSAAGAVAGAGTNLANAQTNIFGQQGQNQANAAYDRAAANSQMVGSIAGGLGNIYANWGGGSRPSGGGFGSVFSQPWVGGTF